MNEMRMMHTRVGLQEDHCFVVVTMMSRQNVQVLCTKRCCWNCYFELRTDVPTHPTSTSNGRTLDGSWTVTQKEKAIEHRCTVRGPLDTKSTPLRRVERRGQAATTRTAIGWSGLTSNTTRKWRKKKIKELDWTSSIVSNNWSETHDRVPLGSGWFSPSASPVCGSVTDDFFLLFFNLSLSSFLQFESPVRE